MIATAIATAARKAQKGVYHGLLNPAARQDGSDIVSGSQVFRALGISSCRWSSYRVSRSVVDSVCWGRMRYKVGLPLSDELRKWVGAEGGATSSF